MDQKVDVEPRIGGQTSLSAPARRRWAWLVLLLVVLASGVAAWRVLGPQGGGGSRQHVTVTQPVGAATIGRGDIRVILNELGTVTPLANVTVQTQINGQLLAVPFQEGQMVKKGDLLAQVDDRPYQAMLAQFQGQLAHDMGLLQEARVDLDRFNILVKQDSIAKQTAQDQAFVVAQDEGSVRTDQAQIAAQELNIQYCHIVAPVDGRIGLRLVDAGNYVQTSGATGIATITQIQPISVIFTLPEDNLPEVTKAIRAGEHLKVVAFDRSDVTQLAEGELATIDNQIDPTTGTVRGRAVFTNADGALFPNQFVNVQLLVDTLQGVTTVPVAAVQRGAPGQFVYVIKPDDTVAVQTVTLGQVDGLNQQVLSGLQPGDRVVVDGADRLRAGAKVTIPPQTPTTQTPATQAATTQGQADAGGSPPRHRRHARPDAQQGSGEQPQADSAH